MILQLKLTLLESDPPVWRRLLVDEGSTLFNLHRMIQIVMGWWDYHLFEFEVKGKRYAGPDDEPEWEEDVWDDASRVSLRSLELRKGHRLAYRYDFGDDWRMEIEVERRRQRARTDILPRLLAGERAGPPEDCGGTHELERILEAFELGPPRLAREEDDGDLEPEERDRLDLFRWLGDYDPAQFDRRTFDQFLVLAGAWGALDP